MKNVVRLTLALLTVSFAGGLSAAEIIKADNSDDMNLPSSWEGGVVPGANDTIVMRPFTTTQKFRLGGDMTVAGLILTNNANLASLEFGGSGEDGVLTLGNGGIRVDNSGKSVTVYTKLKLAERQRWANENGTFVLGSDVDLNGHTLSVVGSIEAKGKANAHDGVIDVNTVTRAGNYKMSSGTYTDNVDFFVHRNSCLQFNQTPAPAGVVRARNVTLDGAGHYDGATLYANGDKGKDGYDIVSGTVAATHGLDILRLQPNVERHQTLDIGALVIQPEALVLFRGTNLGLSPMDDGAANHSTIKFATAPRLIGGGGAAGSTFVSIIPQSICDVIHDGYGSSFATYDATYGIRPLDLETEYASAITSGATGRENVRLVNSTTGEQVTTTLAPGVTEINALMLDMPNKAPGNGGVLVTGPADATLRVKSGLVYGRQMMIDTSATDALTIKGITLDFAGRAGCIISRQTKYSNMTANAPLQLDCVIANDGGEGVSFGSVANRGLIYLMGTAESTYTGPTRILNGNVRLCKDKDPETKITHPAIPGDLYIYGGALQNTGNQLKETADIHVCGGAYRQKGGASNSGTGAWQTFHNLYVSANGDAILGADGTSSGQTTLNDAFLSGGTWLVTRGHALYMQRLTCSGGAVTFGRWGSYDNYRTRPEIQNGVLISNVVATAYGTPYVPITLNSGAWDTTKKQTIPGADLYLSQGLTFVGNEGNTNTVKILAQTPPLQEGVGQMPWGHLRLEGAETFDIGDGAADVDLYINAVVADDDRDGLSGGIVKAGAGTLMLASQSTYTGNTVIQSGRLIADGALAGNVSVENGAVFRGGDSAETGTLTVGGDVSLAAGARLEIDPAACVTVGGTLSFGDVLVVLKSGTALTEDVLVARATRIVGCPLGNLGKYKAKVRKGGTELWLAEDAGMHIIVR